MTESLCDSLSDPLSQPGAAADEADIHHNEWAYSCLKKACARALVRILNENRNRSHTIVQTSLINDNRKASTATYSLLLPFGKTDSIRVTPAHSV